MAYTPPLYNEVNFETTTGYVAPTWNALDADLGVGDVGDTNIIGVLLSSAIGVTTASGKANISILGSSVTSSIGTVIPRGAVSILVTGGIITSSFGTPLVRIIISPEEYADLISSFTTSRTSRSAFVFRRSESSEAAYRRSGFSKAGVIARTTLLESLTSSRINR